MRVPVGYLDAVLGISLLGVGIVWLGETVPRVKVEQGPLWLGVTVVALQTLPLLVRRRAPFAVLVVVMAAAVTYGVFAFPISPIDMAELIALYTVAVHRPTRTLVLGGVVVLGGLGLMWATSPGWTGGPIELVAVCILFALVTVVGLHQRSRLALVATEAEQRAKLDQARAEQAAAEERVALARELHDAVGHAQTVVLFHAGIARMTFDSDPGRSRQALGIVEDRSRATLEERQLLVDSLRSAGGSPRVPLPTLADVDELVGIAEGVGLDVNLTRQGAVRQLPPAIEVSAFRIVQEALTNVVRHAQASRVDIRLRYAKDELGIDVADNGTGTGCTARPIGSGSGKGLVGMRERASALRGTLEAGLGAGGGFVVKARLPLAPIRPASMGTERPRQPLPGGWPA